MIPALITVRYASSRLPGKCLLPFGNFSVLGHCVERALNANMRPIICTSSESSDDPIVQEALDLGVEYYRGNLLNKIKRWSACMENYRLGSAHVIDGDDPFFDTIEIEQSFAEFEKLQLDLMRTSNRSDSGFASLGMSITAECARALAKRSEELPSQDLDVIPWPLLLKESDNWSIAPDNFILPESGFKCRLTLDYEEDYKLLRLLAERFGPSVTRSALETFLKNHPSINSINSHRTSDFNRNKSIKLSSNFALRN